MAPPDRLCLKVTGDRESEVERDREKIRKRELDAFQIATPHIHSHWRCHCLIYKWTGISIFI